MLWCYSVVGQPKVSRFKVIGEVSSTRLTYDEKCSWLSWMLPSLLLRKWWSGTIRWMMMCGLCRLIEDESVDEMVECVRGMFSMFTTRGLVY